MANWTGNAYIDALLLGEKWDTNNLTYYLTGGSSTWNAIETAAIEAALQSWADVANVTFTRTFVEASADLVEDQSFGEPTSLGVHTVHHDYTTATLQTNGAQLNGAYNYNGYGWDENDANGGLQVGGLGYLTIVHEIGHGLGLDHTHDDGGGNVNYFPGVSNSADQGANGFNQDIYSVMSYVHGVTGKQIDGGSGTDNYGFVAGPMAFDIAAIQYMYGANNSYRTGNDTYILSDANQAGTYYSAIWDAGGVDEIVYTGGRDTYIDLRAATLANDDPGAGGYISSAAGILGGFTIANGAVVENASGDGGKDLLIGNEGVNELRGNGNEDVLVGLAGDDHLFGGAGNDVLFGDQTTLNAASISIAPAGANSFLVDGSINNGSIANAIDIRTSSSGFSNFGLNSNDDIDFSTTIPHTTVISAPSSGRGGGRIEYYALQVNNTGAVITLDIDSTITLDSYIQLLDANGTVLASNDDIASDTGSAGSSGSSDSYLRYQTLEAGTYYIAVGAYDFGSIGNLGDTAVYRLHVSLDNEIDAGIVGGDDILDGGAGVDQLFGGAGADRIYYDASDDLANVLGGTGTDTLLITEGSAPVSFDLVAHEFEIAEHSFAIAGGNERDTYNAYWQHTDRTIYGDDGSRSETIFDPTNATDTVQIDNNFDTIGAYVSQAGYYDAGGHWVATFNIPGTNDYIYNYYDAADQLDYTNGRFDTGLTFLEDTDQGNLFDWTNKYAVNTASNQADYQYDYYDDGTRSYLDHDQDGVEIYLYQYTFYDVNDNPDYYYGKYNNGDDFYFDL